MLVALLVLLTAHAAWCVCIMRDVVLAPSPVVMRMGGGVRQGWWLRWPCGAGEWWAWRVTDRWRVMSLSAWRFMTRSNGVAGGGQRRCTVRRGGHCDLAGAYVLMMMLTGMYSCCDLAVCCVLQVV